MQLASTACRCMQSLLINMCKRDVRLQRGMPFHATCFHCLPSHANPAHQYVQERCTMLDIVRVPERYTPCLDKPGRLLHAMLSEVKSDSSTAIIRSSHKAQGILTQSLLASATRQHRDGCLVLGTITCADNRTVCMSFMLADITPCSTVKKLSQ